MRMSQNTYKNDDISHDYFEEYVNINVLVIPSSNIDNLGGDDDNDGDEKNAKLLQV